MQNMQGNFPQRTRAGPTLTDSPVCSEMIGLSSIPAMYTRKDIDTFFCLFIFFSEWILLI